MEDQSLIEVLSLAENVSSTVLMLLLLLREQRRADKQSSRFVRVLEIVLGHFMTPTNPGSRPVDLEPDEE